MNPRVFDRFPVLLTPRLTLREPHAGDAELLFAWRRDAEATRFALQPAPESPAAVAEMIARWQRRFAFKAEIRWTITSCEDGVPVGTCAFTHFVPALRRGHIVYEIAREAWGWGLATEAVRAMVMFGQDRAELDRIEAVVVPGNVASVRVLQKAGFAEEGLMRAYAQHDGRPCDLRMFSIVRGA